MNPLVISPDQFLRLTEHIGKLAAGYLESLDSRTIHPRTSGTEAEALFRSEAFVSPNIPDS